MTKGQRELIEYWLRRADETLDEAKIMLKTNHPRGCTNRLYYACFYAITALLLSKDLSSSKHSGVMSLFNKHFIKPGIIPVAMGKFYSGIFDNRMESDYGSWDEFENESTENDIEQAAELIEKIASIVLSS
ncbi:MAG: HEPN domain-containing protein [Sedimentisphaerales bacterium]